MLWATIIFAMALSLDGFGVGISYGIRKIRIPFKSLMIICITSASALAISMLAGSFIAAFLTEKIAERLGGIALILVGGWLLVQAWAQRLEPPDTLKPGLKDPFTVFKLSIPSLGLVIKILKEPVRADFDDSGEINSNEAVFLGFALAMDALGAGMGAAMMGFSPVFTPLIAGISKFCLVSLGLYLGRQSSLERFRGNMGLIPGLIILFLGAIKIF
ncbi:MAG: sporulation membrane protein YtaF [Peptococcaceae bacterium]